MPGQQLEVTQSVCTTLEGALFNIEKDCLDVQLLGMKSIVQLAD